MKSKEESANTYEARNEVRIGNEARIRHEVRIENDTKTSINMASSNTVRIELLNKENYDTWKIQMQALLTKNEAWVYVSGQKRNPR